MARKIRAVVVDDSALMRRMIPSLLERTGEIEVVATAADPLIARRKIKELNPDVITLDVEMPNMDGLSFLEKIMSLRPMPVVMISSLTTKGADATLQALELGAVDFVAKPAIDLAENLNQMSGLLIEKVKAAAGSRVRARTPRTEQRGPVADVGFKTTETIIAIGASTGGVETLGRLIEQFPRNAPGTVITQHMPAAFTRKFANRLNGHCAVTVREAEQGKRIRPGEVWIAPGDVHLKVRRSGADYICDLFEGPPVSGHCPSVDVLFESVAEACGQRAVGVILTGMGRDGANGMKKMFDAGAYTIGQDEATSIVYGMPKAAFENGSVRKQLPENKILEAILTAASENGQQLRI